MRIIGGKYKKKRFLPVPRTLHVRPTLDRVRETMFQLIENHIDFDGLRVLDAFAGTGSLGLEALSRGAQHITFVESDQNVMLYLKRNSRSLAAEDISQITYVCGQSPTCYSALKTKFDLVFLDPPYGHSVSGFDGLTELLMPHALLVVECAKKTLFTPQKPYSLLKKRVFSQTALFLISSDIL